MSTALKVFEINTKPVMGARQFPHKVRHPVKPIPPIADDHPTRPVGGVRTNAPHTGPKTRWRCRQIQAVSVPAATVFIQNIAPTIAIEIRLRGLLLDQTAAELPPIAFDASTPGKGEAASSVNSAFSK